MSRFVLAPRARADLLDIYEFIAARDPHAAERVADRLEDAMLTLASSPKIGKVCDDLGLPTRRFVVERHRIFYVIEGDDIQIVRVIHSRRDLKAALQLID